MMKYSIFVDDYHYLIDSRTHLLDVQMLFDLGFLMKC